MGIGGSSVLFLFWCVFAWGHKWHIYNAGVDRLIFPRIEEQLIRGTYSIANGEVRHECTPGSHFSVPLPVAQGERARGVVRCRTAGVAHCCSGGCFDEPIVVTVGRLSEIHI